MTVQQGPRRHRYARYTKTALYRAMFHKGGISLLVNMAFFIGLTRAGMALNHSIIVSFSVAALCNYLLCIAILFRHKARWNTGAELFWYIF
jgi:putative flippase GtrA